MYHSIWPFISEAWASNHSHGDEQIYESIGTSASPRAVAGHPDGSPPRGRRRDVGWLGSDPAASRRVLGGGIPSILWRRREMRTRLIMTLALVTGIVTSSRGQEGLKEIVRDRPGPDEKEPPRLVFNSPGFSSMVT